LFWLAGKWISGDHDFAVSWAVGLIALFLGWSLVSTVRISIYQYNSYIYLLRLTDYLLIAIFVANYFTAERSRRWLFSAIAVTGSLVAAYGLINYFLQPAIFATHAVASRIGAAAPYVNHNHFAGYLEMALPVTAGLFIATYRKVRVEASLLLLCLTVFLLLGLLFSLSRAGIISLLVVTAIVSLWVLIQRSNRKIIAPAVLVFLAALGYLSFIETERVERRLKTLGEEETILTMNGRTYAWKAAVNGIKEQPLAGYGPGNFKIAVTRYREPGFRSRFIYAHNDYLQGWLEYGLVGIMLAIVGIGLYGRKLTSILRQRSGEIDFLKLGVGAGILSVLLHSFIDFNLNLHANALLFVVLLSLFADSIVFTDRTLRSRLVKGLGYSVSLILIISGLSFAIPSLRADVLERQVLQLTEEASPFERISLYQQAQSLVPSNAEYSFGLAHSYVLAARRMEIPYFYIKARENFDTALELSPASSEFWLGKAFVEAEVGNKHEAERSFKQAIEKDPQNPAVYFYLSDFLLTEDKIAQAIEYSRRGLELDAGLFRNRLSRLWQYSQDIEQIMQLIPDSYKAGFFLLAEHLYREGQYQDALTMLSRCGEQTRDERPFYNLTGRLHQALNQPDSAEAYFRLGIDKKPADMVNYRHLAVLLLNQKRYAEAEALFETALLDQNIVDKAPLHYEYALYFGRKKEFVRQREQISQALKNNINNPAYLELLADSFLGEQRYYEALRELRRIEALAPERITTFRRIAAIYEKLEQADRATDYCMKILEVNPGDRFGNDLLARLNSPINKRANEDF